MAYTLPGKPRMQTTWERPGPSLFICYRSTLSRSRRPAAYQAHISQARLLGEGQLVLVADERSLENIYVVKGAEIGLPQQATAIRLLGINQSLRPCAILKRVSYHTLKTKLPKQRTSFRVEKKGNASRRRSQSGTSQQNPCR